MVSPEYDAKLKEVAAEIMARVQAERVKVTLIQKPVEMLDSQIEVWKKTPKEQAMKEAVALFRNQGLTPQEVNAKLGVLRFMSEISDAILPTSNVQNIVAISIQVADLPPGMQPIIFKQVQ